MVKSNEPIKRNPRKIREGVDARVNNVLNDLDEMVGKDIPCPICGETTWDCYPNEIGIHFSDLGGGPLSSIHAVALFCSNCRFVRLHGMSTSEGL
jgi:hypothetical protein